MEAPTPDGPIQLTIPEGSTSGRQMRLKGRGIPSSPPGDLYVGLSVVLPKAETEAEKEAYRKFAGSFHFNPRDDRAG